MTSVQVLNVESSLDKVGGGFTFLRNFVKEFNLTDSSWVVFVPNPMQAEIEKLADLRLAGKKIIIRLDNIPEEKNNRGCSSSRLRRLLPLAHHFIYQSHWSRIKYEEFIRLNNLECTDKWSVIYNAADPDVFYPPKERVKVERYLYVHGKGDNKRWPEAQERFRRIYANNQEAELWIVGAIAEADREYNFGFYNGEKYKFFGIQDASGVADIMRNCKYIIYPAFADSCPNTLVEALTCGLKPLHLNMYGGQHDVMVKWIEDKEQFTFSFMMSKYREVFDLYV